MEQKLVHLHTEKELKETEEILKQQGMEIILKTDYLSLDFFDMTEEEQVSYLKTLDEQLEDSAVQLEIQEKEIALVASKKSLTKKYRELLKSYDNSNNADKIKLFPRLREEYYKVQKRGHILYDISHRSREIRLDRRITCSCLIAKMGTEIIRYLAFNHDPVLTIKGPNATSLKSSLQSKF